jgi:hypothetical protein
MYFLRNTTTPLEDLQRNFSGLDWVKTYEETVYLHKKMKSLYPPRFDEINQMWCVDPEYGLSGFAFDDFNSFQEAKRKVINYGFEVAIFQSSDFFIEGGLDGEDVFRDAILIGYTNDIEPLNYNEICDMITKMA